MIELLQPDVDVEPGRKPTHEVGRYSNSIVVRVSNDTELENQVTLSIKCDEPFWRQSWVRLVAAATPTYAQDQRIKSPEYNQDHTACMVYLPHNSSWDILLLFEVPKSPLARPGIYAFHVIATAEHGVEDRIQPPPSIKRGLMVLRPFVEWEIDVDPIQNIVKIWPWRRKGEFQVAVRNKGNDWLYCELDATTDNNELSIELPTKCVAVPPSDLEKESSERTVPVIARTRLKRIRGERQPVPLQIAVVRQDAPSVPPLDDIAQLGGGNLNIEGAVSVKKTSDYKNTTHAALLYCPPVPSTVTEFAVSVRQNIMGIITLLLTIMVFIPLTVIMWHRFTDNLTFDIIHTETASLPARFDLKGKALWGSFISLSLRPDRAEGVDIGQISSSSGKTPGGIEWQFLTPPNSQLEQTVRITLPQDFQIGSTTAWTGQQVWVHARRPFWWLVDLTRLMPNAQMRSIKVGVPDPAVVTGPDKWVTQREISPGTILRITGRNLTPGGEVPQLNEGLRLVKSTSNEIQITVLPTVDAGTVMDVVLIYRSGRLPVGPIIVKARIEAPSTARALEYVLTAQYEKAIHEAQETLKTTDNDSTAQAVLGYSIIKAHPDQEDDAAKAVTKAESLDSDSAIVRTARALIYAKHKEWSKAEQELRSALTVDDKLGIAHNDLGNVYFFGLEDYDRAKVEYERALTCKPQNPEPHGGLGSIYMVKKEYAKAESEFQEAIDLDNANGRWHAYLAGSIYKQGGRNDDAVEEAAQAIDLGFKEHWVYVKLGLKPD